MLAPDSQELFERLVRHIDRDARLIRAWPLEGGVSAEVTALEIEAGGGAVTKVVVRRHGPRDLAANPHVAAEEFKLLRTLRARGLAVPAPRHLDESGDIFPSPVLVVDFVEGTVVESSAAKRAHLDKLAHFLAALHRVDATDPGLAFLGDRASFVAAKLGEHRQRPDDSLSQGEIRERLRAVWPPPAHNRNVVLHGDFWLGNVLWRGDDLAAVIDWEDAAAGDPLADLANARLEIFWVRGSRAMAAFTQTYLALTDVDAAALPCWDLWAALRPASTFAGWGLDAATERTMRDGHREFVAQALSKLATSPRTG